MLAHLCHLIRFTGSSGSTIRCLRLKDAFDKQTVSRAAYQLRESYQRVSG